MIFREGWAIHVSDKKVSVAMRLGALIGLLLVSRLAIGQEVFSSGSAPPTYSDEFSGNCHQGQPPNIWVQLGMNPMACRGQVFPQDSNRQCSLRGMQLLGHIGETCYYCSPIKPPIKGILLPFDQVGNAQHQGYACGVDPLDPNCTAICSKSNGDTRYTPPGPSGNTPRINPSYGTRPGANGPCEDYTGLDMSTEAGRAAAYKRCSDALCQHNPDLERCHEVTIVSSQQVFDPIEHKPLQGGVYKYTMTGTTNVTITTKKGTQTVPLTVTIGSDFTRQGEGTGTGGSYDPILGNVPDPYMQNFVGDLDDSGTQFRVKQINFTKAGEAKFGQKIYRFTGKQPIVNLTQVPNKDQ